MPSPARSVSRLRRVSFSRHVAVAVFAGLLLISLTAGLGADEVHLRHGGVLRHVMVEEVEQDGQKQYRVTTTEGTELLLPSSLVRRVVIDEPALLEYRARREKMEDTVAAHWELAEYCREHRLLTEREFHLWQIVRLDPDHEEARRGLRQSKIEGRWVTKEQLMRERGFVRHKGKWRLPAEVELEQQREGAEQQVVDWKRRIGNLAERLTSRDAVEAVAEIKAIRDPAAIPAITEELNKAQSTAEKRLWIATLERIDHPAIVGPLSTYLLGEDDDDLREQCLFAVKKHANLAATRFFMGRLDPSQNHPIVINRAGRALEVLQTEQAVRSLIEAVVTQHTWVSGGGSGGGGSPINIGFGSGGGISSNFGGDKPQKRTIVSENPAVLAALQAITNVNFGYDKQSWLQWYVQQKADPEIDLRRR